MLEYAQNLLNVDFEKIYIRMNEMDFEGQKKSEMNYRIVLSIFLLFSMIVSFIYQKLSYGVYGIITGLIVAVVVSVPSWSCYNNNHLQWKVSKKETIHKD